MKRAILIRCLKWCAKTPQLSYSSSRDSSPASRGYSFNRHRADKFCVSQAIDAGEVEQSLAAGDGEKLFENCSQESKKQPSVGREKCITIKHVYDYDTVQIKQASQRVHLKLAGSLGG